jgi:hypothetical protein
LEQKSSKQVIIENKNFDDSAPLIYLTNGKQTQETG